MTARRSLIYIRLLSTETYHASHVKSISRRISLFHLKLSTIQIRFTERDSDMLYRITAIKVKYENRLTTERPTAAVLLNKTEMYLNYGCFV